MKKRIKKKLIKKAESVFEFYLVYPSFNNKRDLVEMSKLYNANKSMRDFKDKPCPTRDNRMRVQSITVTQYLNRFNDFIENAIKKAQYNDNIYYQMGYDTSEKEN